MPPMKKQFSRRVFIQLTLLSIGGTLLAACAKIFHLTSNPLVLAPSNTNTPKPTKTRTQTSNPPKTTTPTEIPCFHLLSPVNGAELQTTGKVTFSWEPMPEAAKYRLEIILPTNQPLVFETEKTSRDQYLDALRLGGEYHWQVTAIDVAGSNICTIGLFIFEKPEYQQILALTPTQTSTPQIDTPGGGPCCTGTSGSNSGAN
jgi:hypothetical protein